MFSDVVHRLGLATSLNRVGSGPSAEPVTLPAYAAEFEFEQLLDLGARDLAAPGYFDLLLHAAPEALRPTIRRDHANTLVWHAAQVPAALCPEAPEVQQIGTALAFLGDVKAIIDRTHAARLFSTASALAQAAANGAESPRYLETLAEIVLDAETPEALPPQRFRQLPESADNAAIAEYFAYRYAILEPSIREGAGVISFLLDELRDFSKDAAGIRGEVARCLLERAVDTPKKAEVIKQLCSKIGRKWRFGAIAATILACKAFPGEIGIKLLDAHLERHGSDVLLWRELFADAPPAFAPALRNRLMLELHRYPEQRSLWLALAYAPDVDGPRLRAALQQVGRPR